VVVKIRQFEDLECWQDARELVRVIYAMTKLADFSKDVALVDQIRRSGVSVMANIAEGFYRNSNREFVRFLDMSRSSAGETISHLYVALDQGYIDPPIFNGARAQAEKVAKKTSAFISYLLNYMSASTNQTGKTNITSLTNKTNVASLTNKTNKTNETDDDL
jgi:four helix bundle protein